MPRRVWSLRIRSSTLSVCLPRKIIGPFFFHATCPSRTLLGVPWSPQRLGCDRSLHGRGLGLRQCLSRRKQAWATLSFYSSRPNGRDEANNSLEASSLSERGADAAENYRGSVRSVRTIPGPTNRPFAEHRCGGSSATIESP